MKNSRDRVMLLADKRKEKDVPECEHGYWGGFSPKRDGAYANQHLTKFYNNGRARLYPATKYPTALKKMPHKTLGDDSMS